MANLTETAVFTAGVYQLEETDLVLGGPGGIDNQQAQDLADRTQYLKERADAVDDAIGSFPSLLARLDAADDAADDSGAIAAILASQHFI